jgi:hypothetical protein
LWSPQCNSRLCRFQDSIPDPWTKWNHSTARCRCCHTETEKVSSLSSIAWWSDIRYRVSLPTAVVQTRAGFEERLIPECTSGYQNDTKHEKAYPRLSPNTIDSLSLPVIPNDDESTKGFWLNMTCDSHSEASSNRNMLFNSELTIWALKSLVELYLFRVGRWPAWRWPNFVFN